MPMPAVAVNTLRAQGRIETRSSEAGCCDEGKSETIGPKQPAGMPTCASWVTKAELTLTASGPCELRDAWLWTDQDGTVKMHVKQRMAPLVSDCLPATIRSH